MLKERFASWKLLEVQFLPGLKAQLTFDSEEARVIIEKNTKSDIGGYPCQVVGGGVRGGKMSSFSTLAMNWTMRPSKWPYSVLVRCTLCATSITRILLFSLFSLSLGWSAKVWYRGQPVECDICGEGHVSCMCPLRGKCRFCKEEGHFACNCPNHNRNDWGEVSADGTAPANAEEGPATPVDSAPSIGVISDLRDNQLDKLTGSVAPGSGALSDSLEGAMVVSRVDSLEGTTVVSQEQAPVSQNILAELTVPNLPNSCDAPNSNDCIDLFNERNESSIVTLNNNATRTANSNINNESEIHSNDSSGNNGNSESINITLPNNNEMEVLDNSSDSDSDGSDDPEIRSDASIASLYVDVSSLDSVHSVDHEGFAVPLPKRAPRSSRKPAVVISPDRSRSVSPADGCRSRSPLPSGKHPLPPVVGSRPKSRKS